MLCWIDVPETEIIPNHWLNIFFFLVFHYVLCGFSNWLLLHWDSFFLLLKCVLLCEIFSSIYWDDSGFPLPLLLGGVLYCSVLTCRTSLITGISPIKSLHLFFSPCCWTHLALFIKKFCINIYKISLVCSHFSSVIFWL